MLDHLAQVIRDEIQAMRDEFDVNRHVLCTKWIEFEVAETIPGKFQYTLVPPDFEKRIAKAVLKNIEVCPECGGEGSYETSIGGDGFDGRCCAVADVEVECLECNGVGFIPR